MWYNNQHRNPNNINPLNKTFYFFSESVFNGQKTNKFYLTLRAQNRSDFF